jgi:signal transduction histidine kinase
VADPDLALDASTGSRWREQWRRGLAHVRARSLAGGLGEPVVAVVSATVQPLVLVVGLLAPGTGAAFGDLCVLPAAAAAWLLSPGAATAVAGVAVVVRLLAATLGAADWLDAAAQGALLIAVTGGLQLTASRRGEPTDAELRDRRVRELSFLLDTAQRLSSSLETSVILEKAVQATARGISRAGGGRGSYAAYHQVDGETARVTTVEDRRGTGGLAFEYPLGRNQAAVGAARTGHAGLVRPNHMSGVLRAHIEELGLKVIAMAPVRVGSDLKGLLVASARDHGAVDRHQLRLLEVIAHMTALALANAEHLQRERLHGERMESLEKVKSEILNLVSHELRSPITVALGYVTMLEEGALGSMDLESRSVLPIVAGKLSEMEALVLQMLETSRLQDSALALRPERLDLGEVAQQATEAVAALAPSQHRLRFQSSAGPIPVVADPSRLATILGNLLGNAVKYSPAGGDIHCAVSTDGRLAMVEVTDQGLGIAPKDMSKLFTRFGRIMTRANSGIAGTGLGLHLSRELARQQGGDITAASEPGHGSTFTLTLPLADPTP